MYRSERNLLLELVRFTFFNPVAEESFLFSVDITLTHALILTLSFYFNVLFAFFQGALLLNIYNLFFSFLCVVN
jgi:hypothetical protein